MTIKDHLIDIYIPSYNCKNQITKVLEKIFPHKELFNNIFIMLEQNNKFMEIN